MTKKILVPLKRGDQIEEIIPYLKEVVQPGMSIVFFVHRPVNGFKWLQAYSAIMQCGLEKTLAVRKMVESHSAEMNQRLAQQRVFHTCEALHQLGVKIAVESYTGSLRKTLKSYALNGDVDFLIMRPGMALRMARSLRRAACLRKIISAAGYRVVASVGQDASATH